MCKHNTCRLTFFMVMKCLDCGYSITAPQNCWGLRIGTLLRRD